MFVVLAFESFVTCGVDLDRSDKVFSWVQSPLPITLRNFANSEMLPFYCWDQQTENDTDINMMLPWFLSMGTTIKAYP